jgi:hypothetical protein
MYTMCIYLCSYVCVPAYIYIYLLKPFHQLVIYLYLRVLHIQDVKSSTGNASSLFSTDYDEEVIAF